MWQFGLAEVEVRVRPVQQAELEWYVHSELEPGTEVDYLLGQVTRAAHRARRPMGEIVGRVLLALTRAFGRTASSSGP